MKISSDWLQTFFDKKLPKAEEIARGLTMHVFEIEEIISQGDNVIFDVKVLPNRAHDCLCHYGIAKEVSAIFEIPLSKKLFDKEPKTFPQSNEFSVKIKTDKVKRFKTAVIKGIRVGSSPGWLRERIEAMGGKSINNIVDITNLVMFEIGQPMHAFDADKLKGEEKSFIVRESVEGEKLKTLDDVDRELKEGAILITDGGTKGKTILGIAGIKGGAEAEINEKTKNIILEAATFDAPTIRRHAKLLNIRTDASIRFENGLAPEIPNYATDYAIKLIEENARGENFQVEGEFDYYPRHRNPYKLGVSVSEVNGTLGTNLKEAEVENILKRLGFKHEKVSVPLKRVLELAPTLVDVPYKYGASVSFDAPKFFDCASLTAYIFAQAGVSIPRICVDQYLYGSPVGRTELSPGDLVFSATGIQRHITRYESVEFLSGTKIPEGVDHLGIYMGNNEIIHATEEIGKIVKEKINKSQLFKNIIGYRRILEKEELRFVITVPFERLDLRIKEDLIEEIGRIYGFEHIESVLPEPLSNEPEINEEFYKCQKIREVLVSEGYSEVYTYAMVNKGVVEIENPLASDKSFLRKELYLNLQKNILQNKLQVPLLGLKDHIKVFEIGKVFPESGVEVLQLGIAVNSLNRNAESAEQVLKKAIAILVAVVFKNEIETSFSPREKDKGYVLVDLITWENGIITKSTFTNNNDEDIIPEESSEIKKIAYKAISPYPFALRDIAVFIPDAVTANDVETMIRGNAGEYLVRCDLFDEFKKDGRISYAFHLVFQSNDKTLTDEEISKAMEKIYSKVAANGWQVR